MEILYVKFRDIVLTKDTSLHLFLIKCVSRSKVYYICILFRTFVCTSRNSFQSIRILFHDRTVLSQQANNISSSFSKYSLCQKVLRFTRTAHKGGFSFIKKLKRRLLEPCPSSSILHCKGHSIRFYIFLFISRWIYMSCFSLPPPSFSLLPSPFSSYPLCLPCGKPANLLYRIPSLPPYTISTLSVSSFLDVYICICASLSAGFGELLQASMLVLFPFSLFPFSTLSLWLFFPFPSSPREPWFHLANIKRAEHTSV